MDEDALYRTSTQYRLWSFTPRALSDLRSSTNALAAQRIRAAKSLQPKDESEGVSSGDDNEPEVLTVEEEQKLVSFYCSRAMDFADFCELPTAVKVR